MALPTKEEISQAIEKVGGLNISQLQGFSPVSGILGPESYSGGFCIVFPFVKGNEKKAVRVWHQEIDNIKQRYNLISLDIHNLGSPYLSDVSFVENALDVNGEQIDVVVMEWIEGLPLKNYIQELFDNLYSDIEKKKALKTLAAKLMDMFEYFHSLGFSHGDLQHENIIVTSKEEVKLIDYDCFYTKTLGNGFKQTTSGYRGYQHPKRFSPNIISNEKADYFSELIIYLSIVAIAEDFSLWNIARDSDFSFLLTEQDYDDLDHSSIAAHISSLSKKCEDLICILRNYLGQQDINNLFPFTFALFEKHVTFSSSASKAIRDKQTVTITWDAPAGTIISLQYGRKDKALQEQANRGRYETVLHEDTTFELSARSTDGIEVKKVLTVKVFDESRISFSADKLYVYPRIPIRLTWNVKNAKHVWLGDEEVSHQGEKVVEQDKATTYILKVEDEFGIKEERICVNMLPVPQVKSLLVPTPYINNNLSVRIVQPQYNVSVEIPEITVMGIDLKVPKVPSLKDSGLMVDLSLPELKRPSLLKEFKSLFRYYYNKIKHV